MREKIFWVGGTILLLVLVGYIVWGWYRINGGGLRFETKISMEGVSGFKINSLSLKKDLRRLEVGKMVYKDVGGETNNLEVGKMVFELVSDVGVVKVRLRGGDGNTAAGFGWEIDGDEELVKIYVSPLVIASGDEKETNRLVYWAILNSFDRLKVVKNEAVQERIDELVGERTKKASFPVTIRLD
ncbi:hypothetical protein KJ953_00900 [Patescibacteria group bacterium]|nr:hypothetical protein [Patescibacteria group bacterium]